MSSTEWGGLRADRLPLEGDSDDAGPTARESDAGAWPEEIEIRSYAESAMTLPGMGDPGPDCGTWLPTEFCDECGEPHFGVSRCERRTCPDCWTEWTRQRAVGATTRLSAARMAEDDGIDRRAVHAVVSPPEGEIRTLQDVSDGFRDAYRLAERKGIRGGVAVFHGFRATEQAKERYREQDPDTGLWQWIRDQPERWRALSYWSPHWHIVGLCRDFEADDVSEQDGWVARRLRSLAPMTRASDRDAIEDVVGCVRYLMSHATFESDTSKDCVRWFGDLATSKFSARDQLSDGTVDVIERVTQEVVGLGDDRDDDHVGGLDEDDQECRECGSSSMSLIWDAGAALQDPGWCDRIGRDQQRRLTAAFEWAIGDRLPPPGLKRPQSETDAIEALEALV